MTRGLPGPGTALCLWTGAVSDLACAQSPAPAAIRRWRRRPRPCRRRRPPPAQSRRRLPRRRPPPAPQPAVPAPQSAASRSPAAAAALPPAELAAGRPLHRAVLPDAGRRVGHRPADLPLLHPDRRSSRPSRRRVGAVRRADRADHPRGLQAPVGAPTSSTTCRSRSTTTRSPTASIGKIVIYNMEERQRVKIVDYIGIEEDRAVEDRREAEGRERHDPPRLVHRSGAHPQGRGHRPRHDGGEGLPVAEVTPRDQADAGRAEAGAPHVQHRRRARRSRSATIDFVGNKAISDGKLEQADEGQQGRSGWLSFITGRGTYKEDQVRGGRRQGRRSTTANNGYIARARRRSPS